MSNARHHDESSPLTGTGKVWKARASVCSRLQAPVQSFLRPAMWIPGLNRLHSYRDRWQLKDSNPQMNLERIQRALRKVIKMDKTRSDFIVSKVEKDFLQIHVFTRVEWLDVIEMRFEGSQIKRFPANVYSRSLSVEHGKWLTIHLQQQLAFFWVPFLDWGMNKKRLVWIRSQLDLPVQ